MNFPKDLLAGDTVGFKGESVVRWKTGGEAGHVVVYIGNGLCVTSDTDDGVGVYTLASQGVPVWARRPKQPVDLASGMAWFDTVKGQKYGWADDERDAGLPVPDPDGTMNCSHTSAEFYRNAKAPQFDPKYNAKAITPAHFESTFESAEVWNVQTPVPA